MKNAARLGLALTALSVLVVSVSCVQLYKTGSLFAKRLNLRDFIPY